MDQIAIYKCELALWKSRLARERAVARHNYEASIVDWICFEMNNNETSRWTRESALFVVTTHKSDLLSWYERNRQYEDDNLQQKWCCVLEMLQLNDCADLFCELARESRPQLLVLPPTLAYVSIYASLDFDYETVLSLRLQLGWVAEHIITYLSKGTISRDFEAWCAIACNRNTERVHPMRLIGCCQSPQQFFDSSLLLWWDTQTPMWLCKKETEKCTYGHEAHCEAVRNYCTFHFSASCNTMAYIEASSRVRIHTAKKTYALLASILVAAFVFNHAPIYIVLDILDLAVPFFSHLLLESTRVAIITRVCNKK